ncbi:MAG TPA: hypothetical protein VKY89_09390 [Thermoanaerobaculia bacterium]|jgi:hypothetical protein|nr:hypothetical protein [Thermoanaerobaculia bacterium]
MPLPDALVATLAVTKVLEGLAIPYLIAGSLASSYHGIPRSTADADLVAALRVEHAVPLVSRLAPAFYVDLDRVLGAIQRRSSFNAIHLATMVKVDFFILQDTPAAQKEMERRQPMRLTDPPEIILHVASAEDTIVQKLAWYRLGREVSEHQWKDVLGIIKVKRQVLDLAYLRDAAAALAITDLLDRALIDSGIERG